MPSESLLEFYQRRADEERSAAGRAADSRARASHLEMARRYVLAAAQEGSAVPFNGKAAKAGAPVLPAELKIIG